MRSTLRENEERKLKAGEPGRSHMNYKLFEKLNEPEYRKAFVASQINIGIPFQIRALLKSRPGWTQATLAERAEMKQPRISGLMTPGKVRPNIETLRRVAEAFDVGLSVRFVPFSELARWSEDFNPESFYVPNFANDAGFVERRPQATAGALQRPSQPPLEDAQRNSATDRLFIAERGAQVLAQQQRPMLGCSA